MTVVKPPCAACSDRGWVKRELPNGDTVTVPCACVPILKNPPQIVTLKGN